jgi:hypothetical protein
MYPKIKV